MKRCFLAHVDQGESGETTGCKGILFVKTCVTIVLDQVIILGYVRMRRVSLESP
jgi:hypothetical protein